MSSVAASRPSLLRALPVVALVCFTGPARSALADDHGGRPVVVGTEFTLDSAVYDAPRTLVIRLPKGYAESDREYPVLYVVDGGADQDFVPMAGMAALAWLTEQYRQYILVGVQTENRYHELTVRSELEEDLEDNPDSGGAADFRQHLIEEVKPYIDNEYRVSTESALIGESLAGLFITETFLRTPRAFTHYVAVSPSLWWRGMALSKEAEQLLQAQNFPADRSFYLTLASEGGTMREGVERVAAALEAHAPDGLRWWYDPMPEEDHHTIYNPATLRALRWIFPPEEG